MCVRNEFCYCSANRECEHRGWFVKVRRLSDRSTDDDDDDFDVL